MNTCHLIKIATVVIVCKSCIWCLSRYGKIITQKLYIQFGIPPMDYRILTVDTCHYLDILYYKPKML